MEISILSLKMKRFSTSLVDWANPAVSEFHHSGELLAILYSEQQDGGMHHKKFINGVGTGCGWDFLNTLQKSTGDLRMADDGVRGGCGSGIFCPDTPVTRGQMAVFIESALGHASSTCTGQFTDVPVGHPFCRFIEHLAADGITGGSGEGRYCPDDPVTRAQMAVFLVAAPPTLAP